MRTGLTVGSYNSSLTLFAAREDGSFLLGSVQNEVRLQYKMLTCSCVVAQCATCSALTIYRQMGPSKSICGLGMLLQEM